MFSKGKDRSHGQHVARWVALVLVAAAPAAGQMGPVSTIQSTGTASVDVPPDHVDFWLHKEAGGATFVEAMQTVLQFGPVVRKTLAKQEVGAFDLTLSAPAIADIAVKGARVSAQIRFSMNPFSNRETGPEQFAGLCDKMAALAEALECYIEGPMLGVQDPGAVEQDATALATENALPVAQATAELMNAQISAVEHVIIEACAWNAAPDTRAPLPDVRRLTCTARVHVTYAFSAGTS